MLEVKNVLEVINEVFVLPIAIITFFILVYIVMYLWKKDPDVIRSRIFLKYTYIKKAFLLLVVFAFLLVLHVALIYIPHYFSIESYYLIENIQKIFGLLLIFSLLAFAYVIFRSLIKSNSELT